MPWPALRFLALPLSLSPLAASAGGIDFSREIRPILSENCFFCHGPDENKREAGLRLDEEGAAKSANDGVIAVVPGHPERSALIERITSTDPDEVMPPPKQHKTISPAEVALLKEWIQQGAPWGKHWSYEKVVKPETPEVGDACPNLEGGNPIDAFIGSRLAREGLKFAAEADAATLVRRVALDLTGLPPTMEEVDRFLPLLNADRGTVHASGYGRMVDHFMSKPAFGEHWARMWLDLARYADSAGYPSDPGREIWAYRDWVIGAFNSNLPFDRFTIEQMAGDLLPSPNTDQLIATAFHRNTMTQNEGGTDDEEFRVAAVIDRVNTTMAVWMGTTMACAQCHTHKYDPLTITEYYQFYAFLNQSADTDKKDESPLHSFYPPEFQQQSDRLKAELAVVEKKFAHPEPGWLAGITAWDAAFPRNLAWEHPKPDSVATKSGHAAAIADDGVVSVKESANTDTYTIELPAIGEKLSALRLETLPTGGRGDFVITGLTAEVIPSAAQKAQKARFVRIELPGKGKMLQLAEVQAFSGGTNVATQGEAKHSSQYIDAEAGRAIDGQTDGDYAKGSVSHTSGKDHDPWWEVDLKSTRSIDRVVVWNRTDGGTGSRLEGFRVVLLDDKRQTVWKSESNAAPKAEKEFAVNGPIPVTFATALADYEQAGFAAASVLKPKNKTNQGWAVGGATDKPHTLTLLAATPVVVPDGSALRISIVQDSSHKQHTLGSFRVGFTGDAGVQQLTKTPVPVVAALVQPAEKRTPAQQHAITDYYVRNIANEAAVDRQRLAALNKEMAALKPVTVPVMQDLPNKERRKTQIQQRGNWQDLGEEVAAATPAVFHPLRDNEPRNRLALAKWLVSRDNPLTARVTANRFWESIFGTGIVRTSEEFGSQGELPFHPELLDWLGAEFMETGWDVKRLIKLMVTSHAYRQDSRSTDELNDRDPENRLLARGPRFRPTGELLRDQALAVSGLLSPKMLGKPVRPMRPNLGLNTAFGGTNDWVTSEGEDRHRRSVYTEVKRNSPYPSFTTFDAPNREVCTLRRGRTNTPLQAFVTLNDPVFIEANQGLARRVSEQAGGTAARLQLMFKLCLSRDPTAHEQSVLQKLFADTLTAYRADADLAMKLATEPIGPAPDGANIAELASWTAVANVVMNMDEFLMRK